MTIPSNRGECNARSLVVDLGNRWANNFREGVRDTPNGIGSFDLRAEGSAHRPMKPGPQPQNQIAGTFCEQRNRALRPRRSSTPFTVVKAFLARVRATEAGLISAARAIAANDYHSPNQEGYAV